jgi:hypothetical protein
MSDNEPLLQNIDNNDEEFMSLVYKYYELKGIINTIALKISNLVTTLFLLFAIVFITTFIDYSILFKSYKLEDSINWSNSFNPILIVYMIFYLTYWLWKFIKSIYDIKKLWTIHKFYQELNIDTFTLQHATWGQIISKILTLPRFRKYNASDITNLIMRKDNYTTGVIKFILGSGKVGGGVGVSISNILEWELNFVIFNYLFSKSKLKLIDNNCTTTFRKQLKIIGVINILLGPFLLIFAGVYVVFRYGEIIYTNPTYLTWYEWSKWIRYTKIRDYSELPHEYLNRLHLAKKYANKYINLFKPGLIYNLAQLLLMILGIICVLLITLTIINFNFLSFELWGRSCSQYLSFIITTIFFLKRYIDKFNTRDCNSICTCEKYLEKLLEILKCKNDLLTGNGNGNGKSKHVFIDFSSNWYQSRLKIILIEIWGIITLPYIFIKVLPNLSDQIINYLHQNTQSNELIGDILVPVNLFEN